MIQLLLQVSPPLLGIGGDMAVSSARTRTPPMIGQSDTVPAPPRLSCDRHEGDVGPTGWWRIRRSQLRETLQQPDNLTKRTAARAHFAMWQSDGVSKASINLFLLSWAARWPAGGGADHFQVGLEALSPPSYICWGCCCWTRAAWLARFGGHPICLGL